MKLYDTVAQIFRHLQPPAEHQEGPATPVHVARWHQDGPAQPSARA